MSERTMQLAREGFGAWQRGDFDTLEAMLDLDVRWHWFEPGAVSGGGATRRRSSPSGARLFGQALSGYLETMAVLGNLAAEGRRRAQREITDGSH